MASSRETLSPISSSCPQKQYHQELIPHISEETWCLNSHCGIKSQGLMAGAA